VLFVAFLIFGGALETMPPVLTGGAANTAAVSAAEVAYDGARALRFNEGWKFKLLNLYNFNDTALDNAETGARALGYDDSAWQDVDLPHDWSIYQAYENTNGIRANQGALPAGTGWYRKSFTLPDELKGKAVTIRFDGVMQVSEVFVNGVQNTSEWKQYLGYVTFAYDITDYLKFDGQTNTIAVKCQSSNNGSRWYQGAGIYRNVWLTATDPVRVPENGVFVTTPKAGLAPEYALYTKIADPTSARAVIRTDVANGSAAGRTVSVRSTVYNREDGDVAAVTTENVEVPANGTGQIVQSVDVPHPALWSVDAPNLYWVKTEILSGAAVLDRTDTRFGIRYIDIDPDSGLYLNGVQTPLNGVCEHSDLGPLGMETYAAAVDRRIRKLKSMGVNAIRTAHNPVSPEYIEACDRLGMLVMEEAFDMWLMSKSGQDYTPYFNKSTADGTTVVFSVSGGTLNWNNPDLTPNCKRDIQAMVDRDKNAPSVFTWSTGNEITDTMSASGLPIVSLLAQYIREIDPTRPVASCPPTWNGWSDGGYMEQNMALVDIAGFNYAHTRYDGFHQRHPAVAVVGSETVSAYYTRGAYFAETYGQRVGKRDNNQSSNYPFEYTFSLANTSLTAHRDSPFALGEFVWTGHDYLGEPTPHGWPSISSVFGIIDTCGFEKDAFYLYKSAWTDIPVAHLLPQNWTKWKLGDQVPVIVYTNARRVELYLNDALIDTKTYDRATANPMYLEFGRVTYAPGELKAIAYDADGNVVATDSVYTADKAARVELAPDRAFVKNDGYDLVYVEATVRDSAGLTVPDAANRIMVDVTGGRVVAVGNGDPTDHESQRGRSDRRAFYGKALFIVAPDKGYEGDITVTATSAGLSSNTAIVRAVSEDLGDGTLVETYEKPEITVGVGVTPAMPQNIRVVLDNGLIQERAVSEWDLGGVNLGQAGGYTAYGAADGVPFRVEAALHVKEVAGVGDVEVTTITGVYPPLPKFVTLTYADGEIGAAQVAWAPVAAPQYAQIGAFAVAGQVGASLTAHAAVTVKQPASVREIDVVTTAGEYPTLPSSVAVVMNDGGEDTLPVTWTVTPDDYAYPGAWRIFGKVLGSDSVAATANLRVRSRVYLSDMTWESAVGQIVKDKTVGGSTLSARNMQGAAPTYYTKGIGTLADATLTYDIAGKGYDDFSALVSLGFDYGQGYPGAVNYQVYLDGALAYESGFMTHADAFKRIDLSVRGVSELKLAAVGSGDCEQKYNLADWCDAQFLADNIVVDAESISLPKQIYTNTLHTLPNVSRLPYTVEAALPGAGTGTFKVAWPALTPELFQAAGVHTMEGVLAGTAHGGAVSAKIITDYKNAVSTPNFHNLVGIWSETESFDYPEIASAAYGTKKSFSAFALNPRLVYAATANMIIENVHNYGFDFGAYPSAAGAGQGLIFAAPNLSYFQVTSVSQTAAQSDGNSFTFDVSPDGETWTALPGADWTKSGILSGTGSGGTWPRRTYTSHEEAIPAGVNFLRVNYPSGTTWNFNITSVALRGGGESNLSGFKLAGYEGAVDRAARAVSVIVPQELDIARVEPEITVSAGASYSPTGPQDFTKPVVYTVSNDMAEKKYTVTVSRGFTVRFDLNGGAIDGNPDAVAVLVRAGGAAGAPAAPPTKSGFAFKGWAASPAGKTAVDPGAAAVTENTAFYAIWEKVLRFEVAAEADAHFQTWQGEKANNYSTGDMKLRRSGNTGSTGLFGEKFTSTSTSDSTDMKTALIRFDIGQFKEEDVSSATLHIWNQGYGNGSAAASVEMIVARASSNWVENQVTWNRWLADSGVFYVDEGVAATAPFAPSWGKPEVSVDVTGLFKNVPAGEDKLSLALSLTSASCDYLFISKERTGSGDEQRRPMLVVELVAPPTAQEVVFALNGGSGDAPILPALEPGETFEAPRALGLTGPAGKLFKEWNTEEDGTGAGVLPGGTVAMPAEGLTLYAIWAEAKGMLVSHDADGADAHRVARVTVRALAPGEARLILASYGAGGALLSVRAYALDADGQQEQDIAVDFASAEGARVTAFLWGGGHAPLAEPMAVR
jgi:beta-galactosidase